MPRYPHYIGPAKQCDLPQSIICVDCESEDVVHAGDVQYISETLTKWRAICLRRSDDGYKSVRRIYGTTTNCFWVMLETYLCHPGNVWIFSWQCNRIWSLLDLWGEIENERWVIAGTDARNSQRAHNVHNVRADDCNQSNVDGTGTVMRGLRERRMGYLVIEDPPNIANVRPYRQPGWITWVDTRNYGVEYSRDGETASPVVDWLASFVDQFTTLIRSASLGKLCATAGSQAMHGWRHGYYRAGIHCNRHTAASAIEESALYGGRCECYKIGDIPGEPYHLDVRSMYPSICAGEQLPCRLVGTAEYGDGEPNDSLLEQYGCIAIVDIETDEPSYPYRRQLPQMGGRSDIAGETRGRQLVCDTDIIYPIGRFTTTLAGPELLDALGRRRIVRWHRLAYYQCEDVLREYAEALYRLRTDAGTGGQRALADLLKRLLVCLPGKFGQRDRRWVSCPDQWSDVRWGEWVGRDSAGNACRYRSIGGVVQRDEIGGFAADSAPAIAAWITSAGRIKLLNIIRSCGWENTYYVDTDAIICSAEGYHRLESQPHLLGEGLGRLQIVSRGEKTRIEGIKYYIEGNRVICSGLPRGVRVDCNDGRHYMRVASPSECARAGERPSADRRICTYSRSGEYRHGSVQRDGSVKPIVIEEW